MTQTTTFEKIVGSWGLISIHYLFDDGTTKEMYGEKPIGILTYDPCGYMNAQLGAGQRQQLLRAERQDEPQIKSAFYDSYIAYYGTYYEESEGTIIHQVIGCTNPAWIGEKEIRHVELNGDRLRIWTPCALIEGKSAVIEVFWKRL